jgi:hypothetical protein
VWLAKEVVPVGEMGSRSGLTSERAALILTGTEPVGIDLVGIDRGGWAMT